MNWIREYDKCVHVLPLNTHTHSSRTLSLELGLYIITNASSWITTGNKSYSRCCR